MAILTLFRVMWVDGLRRSAFFEDKFEAQDLVLRLQSQGFSPRVDRVEKLDQQEQDLMA